MNKLTIIFALVAISMANPIENRVLKVLMARMTLSVPMTVLILGIPEWQAISNRTNWMKILEVLMTLLVLMTAPIHRILAYQSSCFKRY